MTLCWSLLSSVAFADVGVGVDSVPSTGVEKIVDFNSKIFVHKNGTIDVTENILYDFGVVAKHGIFRYIPFQNEWVGKKPSDAVDGSKYLRVFPTSFSSVKRDGSDEHYTVSTDKSVKTAKIGEKDTLIAGQHHYTIKYTMKNFATTFTDHDELYFNVTGNGWLIGMDRVHVAVQYEDATITNKFQAACFAGAFESTATCGPATIDGSKIVFDQLNVNPSSGMTIDVASPKGVLVPAPPVLQETWSFASAFRLTPVTISTFFVLLFLTMGALLFVLFKAGRNRRYVGNVVDVAFGNTTGQDEAAPIFRRGDSMVEFVPPDKIRPGQMGVLLDETVDDIDLTATLIDLAVRGYLHIDQKDTDEKTIFGGTRHVVQYALTKTKEYKDDQVLRLYEIKFLDVFFSDGDTFDLSTMTRLQGEFLIKVQKEMYKDVVKMKWYTSPPDKARAKWKLISSGVLWVVLPIAFLMAYFTHFGFSAIALVITGATFRVLYKKMPMRTAKGTAMVGRVAGFRQLFDAGEAERQELAAKAHYFLDYLPYAMVFGCGAQWAEIFEGLGLTQEQLGTTRFYTGNDAFSPALMAASMNHFSHVSTGVMSAAQTSATRASSGSSGFCGGGSSGGGGGGGGGGSW